MLFAILLQMFIPSFVVIAIAFFNKGCYDDFNISLSSVLHNGGTMNTFEQEVKELIINRYGNLKRFTDKIQMPWTTLDSILKRGIANSNVSNVSKVAKELNLDLEAFIEGKLIFSAPVTVAAHRDSEDWTPEEYQKIEDYKRLLLAARAAKQKQDSPQSVSQSMSKPKERNLF